MADTLVLCYHAVSPTWDAALSTTPELLRSHLELLRDQGYRGVTFTEAVSAPHRGKRVAVTFDDAFTSVPALGKPILDELGWPGTMFAVSDHVRDGWPLAWEGTQRWLATPHEHELAGMGVGELKLLLEAGWEVGSHTSTHPFLTRLDDAELAEELQQSRAWLAEALDHPCDSIAYPYGDHDARVIAATRAAGYRHACTLPARWPKPEPLAWPRVGVYHADDLRRYRVKTSPAVRRARQLLGR